VSAGAEKTLLLVLQQYGGGIHPISRELAAAAVRLAEQGGLRSAGILITGELGEKAGAELRGCGLGEVYVYEDPRYHPFIAEYHCAALLHLAGVLRPEVILAGATPEGRVLAPMAAIHLKSGVTADCTGLSMEQGLLVQTRPAFGGNVMARIVTPIARPQIATVRYGILRDSEKASAAAETRIISAACPLPAPVVNVMVTEETFREEGGADIILALGGGVRAKEDIERFRAVCAAGRIELMCSRSLVERGWFPRSRQIGLSGRSVSPRLLLTLGVSGSVQFAAGIQGARKIIAVTTDPEAPILRIADIPLIADIYQVIEELDKILMPGNFPFTV
jgi:electron transfer flavoprotein alpha subunit